MQNTESRQLVELIHTPSDTKFRIWLTDYELNRANSDQAFLDELTNKYYGLHTKNLVTPIIDSVEVDHGKESTLKPEPAKLWTFGTTKFLISLVKKFDDEFQTKVKKHVWQKIATQISSQTKLTFSAQQCDTKFKGLKDMYKNIKQHNEKSGNDAKNWIFFNDMDEFMYKKPEIVPPVTCSSSRGLQINNSETVSASTDIDCEGNTSDCNKVINDTPKRTGNLGRKRIRRYENAVDKRHKDKMQRQDRFLDLFEDMVKTLKNKESK